MSVLENLKSTSLQLRKDRDPLAKSISVVVSSATQIAKERAPDKNNFTVSDDDAIQAVRKAVKQAEDTVAVLTQNNVNDGDLYNQSLREISILKNLLPQAPTDETIRSFVGGYISNVTEPRSIKLMGPIMKALGEQFGSSLDRSVASQVIREELMK